MNFLFKYFLKINLNKEVAVFATIIGIRSHCATFKCSIKILIYVFLCIICMFIHNTLLLVYWIILYILQILQEEIIMLKISGELPYLTESYWNILIRIYAQNTTDWNIEIFFLLPSTSTCFLPFFQGRSLYNFNE